MQVRKYATDALNPEGWNQWKITATIGKSGDTVVGTTYVRAASEDRAKELGKTALRMLGVRGRFVVLARIYRPWADPEIQPYLGYRG